MIDSRYQYQGNGLYVSGAVCREPPLGHDFRLDRTEENVEVFKCQLCGAEYGKESSSS